MKTVLVPTEQHDLMPSCFETAWLLATRFESYVEGFPLRPVPADVVPVDMVIGLAWTIDEKADEEAAKRARHAFEGFFMSRDVKRAVTTPTGLSFGWKGDPPVGDGFLGSYSRIFDATVVGRPGQGLSSPRMSTLEAVLFEGGRPVLIAPPTPPASLGRVIVVAWNGSTETAHAAALAMPLLLRAERVVVLTVPSGMVPGPTGEELARSLRVHGVKVEAMTVESGRRGAGETFLTTAASLGCDLLVKGAYTQSRIRQMIFGGATSHILGAATIPVFMAH